MFRTLPWPRGARWSGLRGWNRKVARGLRSSKAQDPSKIDPFVSPTQTKTSPSPTPTVIHFFDPAPNFPAPAFSFQLARLQGSSCYHRISGYEHGPASVVMPATSGPGHRRPCGSRPWTTRLKPRPRIHEKLKITWLNSAFMSSPSHFHHVFCKVYQWAFRTNRNSWKVSASGHLDAFCLHTSSEN